MHRHALVADVRDMPPCIRIISTAPSHSACIVDLFPFSEAELEKTAQARVAKVEMRVAYLFSHSLTASPGRSAWDRRAPFAIPSNPFPCLLCLTIARVCAWIVAVDDRQAERL